MKILKTITINKSIEVVWEVIWNQFSEISKWSSYIKESKVYGQPKLEGLGFSTRELDTINGIVKQEVTSFNSKQHTVTYKPISGMPPIIKELRVLWALSKKDANSTNLTLDFAMNMKGMGHLLAPLVKMKLGKVNEELLEELKHYVEKGQPHPRKLLLKL